MRRADQRELRASAASLPAPAARRAKCLYARDEVAAVADDAGVRGERLFDVGRTSGMMATWSLSATASWRAHEHALLRDVRRGADQPFSASARCGETGSYASTRVLPERARGCRPARGDLARLLLRDVRDLRSLRPSMPSGACCQSMNGTESSRSSSTSAMCWFSCTTAPWRETSRVSSVNARLPLAVRSCRTLGPRSCGSIAHAARRRRRRTPRDSPPSVSLRPPSSDGQPAARSRLGFRDRPRTAGVDAAGHVRVRRGRLAARAEHAALQS